MRTTRSQSENISIALELPSLNFNSVRAELSFAIRYLNIVIKSLFGNLDICLSYHANAFFHSRNSVRMMSVGVCDRR